MSNRRYANLFNLLMLIVLSVASQPAAAQFIQQGPKLVGTGATGAATQGASIALSADGNTAILGGTEDASNVGAAWVFTRNSGAWSQQGSKLVGTGAVVNALQGQSVALSSDGNTAILGGPNDNSSAGAVWVFTRSGGIWTQQGSKLIGTGASGSADQGWSVALSSDGNTAIVGGPNDNSSAGAAWIFTRTAGMWTQQGAKLVGTGALNGLNGALQGWSVALSGDGNTAIVGGWGDNANAGAAWVFTRSGGVWSQQGSKLVGTGAINAVNGALQGYSVAISANSDTALIGGREDDSATGASWVFTRSGATGTQQGSKLVGTGAIGNARQGNSVSLSADGNTATAGGKFDNSGLGAAWIFTRSGTIWTQYGSKLVGAGSVGNSAQGQAVALSGDGLTAIMGGDSDNADAGAAWVFTSYAPHDFNGNGKSDILWRHTNGSVTTWQMNANGTHTAFNLGVVSTAWQIAGTSSSVASTGDINGGGKSDVFWRHTNGSLMIWLMNGGASYSSAVNLGTVPTAWQIVGVGDFDGDGLADILWRHTNGSLSIWTAKAKLNFGVVDNAWHVAGIGDVNHDGIADIFWRHTNGTVLIWQMNGASHTTLNLGVVATAWQIVGIGDVDGDGNADIFWRHTNGSLSIWKMAPNGTHTALNLGVVPTAWHIASIGDYNGDHHADILWRHTNGGASIWTMNANGTHTPISLGTVATAWTIVE